MPSQQTAILTRSDESSLSKYDAVIDVAVEGANRNVRFFPMNESLEGEVRAEFIHSDRPSGLLNQLGGVIPGQRLYVDLKNMTVKVIDRKTLPEWRAKTEKARELTRADQFRHMKFNSYKADIDISVPESEWPTWLFHIRRKIDQKKFRLVSGKIPSISEIEKMDGKITYSENMGLSSKDSDRPFWEHHPKPVKQEAKKGDS